MANMFSGKINTKIPKTLSDCIYPDATVSNLHTWAERLETWGKIVFYILIGIGILSTIVEGIATGEYLENLDEYFSRQDLAAAGMEIPSVFDVVVSSIIKWAFFAFIEYCSYHVLALIVSALASITQHTIISANVALYESSQNHPETVSTQAANTTKPVLNDKPAVATRSAPAVGMWTCKNCGTNNSLNYGQCKKCGKYKC